MALHNIKYYLNMTSSSAERLKKFMEAYRLSISDLSCSTGLETSNITNILYGKSRKVEYLKKIAEHYNVPLQFFTNQQADHFVIEDYLLIHNILIEILKKYKTVQSWPQELIFQTLSEAYMMYKSDIFDINQVKAYIKGAFDTITKAKLVDS